MLIAVLPAPLRRLLDDRRGTILVEIALVLPMMLFMMLATVDIGRALLLTQKLNRSAVTLADLIAREETVDTARMTELFTGAGHVMSPFAFNDDGVLIVSIIRGNGDGTADVEWQQRGAGTGSALSRIGTTGDEIALPAGLVLDDGESLVVSEAAYTHEYIFLPELGSPVTMYYVAFARPRRGDVTAV